MNVEKHISLIWLVAQTIDINRKKDRIIREKLEIENWTDHSCGGENFDDKWMNKGIRGIINSIYIYILTILV